MCRGGACSEFTTGHSSFGLIYSRVDAKSLLTDDAERPIRILLRVESMDMTVPAETARRQLTQDLQAFLGSVRLDDLTRPYAK